MTCQLLAGLNAGLMMLSLAGPGWADTLVFESVKDNTLIESATGSLSNGLGDGIFAGRLGSTAGGMKMRAVLKFNLAAIPPGSTINSASLKLSLVQGHGGTQTHTIHRLLGDFGEGTSYSIGGNGAPATPNDATWLHKFYPNVYWTTPGGDYVLNASATASVGNSGSTTWTSAALASDVKMWVDNAAVNFGWMVKGNEVTLSTAKKFLSHNWDNNPDTPRLTVNFTPPPPPVCAPDVNHDGVVNVTDLLAVINAWGSCQPQPASCPADVAPDGGNGNVDVSDLLRVIDGWGPCA